MHGGSLNLILRCFKVGHATSYGSGSIRSLSRGPVFSNIKISAIITHCSNSTTTATPAGEGATSKQSSSSNMGRGTETSTTRISSPSNTVIYFNLQKPIFQLIVHRDCLHKN